MSISLDGFEVLRRVGKHAEIFAPVRADADKAARALVVKCLKAKAVDIDALHDIAKALGDDAFELLLDGMKDTEIKSVLTRLDKHFAELKTGSAADRSKRLRALAERSADPSPPPAKAAKKAPAKKAKKPETPARLHSEVTELFRAGNKKKD